MLIFVAITVNLNACFDCLNQIDAVKDHIKLVFNVAKRHKRKMLFFAVQMLKHTTTDITALLFDCPNSLNTKHVLLCCFKTKRNLF